MSKLHHAQRGVLAIGLLLLASLAAAQAVTNAGLNAQLLMAARQGDVAAVQSAFSRGAAPNSRNRARRC